MQRCEAPDWHSTNTTRYKSKLSPYFSSTTTQNYRDGLPSRPSTLHGTQPWSYMIGGCTSGERELSSSDFFSRGRTPTSPPVGGISFPAGELNFKLYFDIF